MASAFDSVMISVADLLGIIYEGEEQFELAPPSDITGRKLRMTLDQLNNSPVGQGIRAGYMGTPADYSLTRNDGKYPTLYEAMRDNDVPELYRRGYCAGEQFRTIKLEVKEKHRD
jgi:hypothetical protein